MRTKIQQQELRVDQKNHLGHNQSIDVQDLSKPKKYATAAACVCTSVISSDSDDGIFINDSQIDENSYVCKTCGVPHGSEAERLSTWIQCDFCDQWMHASCAYVSDVDILDTFMRKDCV